MLHNYLEAQDVAQQIRMERSGGATSSFFVLEGRNDQRTLYTFVDDEHCEIVIAGKKENVVGAIQILDEEGIPGVVGLIDTDAVGADYQSENLIDTGVRDMDVIVFLSEAFDRFIFERADPDKLKAFEEKSGKTLRRKVLDACVPIGCLWLVRYHMQVDLKFKGLKYNFVDEDDLSIDESALLNDVLDQSCSGIDRSEVERRYKIIRRQPFSAEDICRGHDLAEVTGIALRKCVADLRCRKTGKPDVRTWRSEVELGWRLSFGSAQFQASPLMGKIQDWEDEHQPYTVLKH
ncbi:DUF4435 domain-containing protein [Thalassospira sp. MCCC 1A02491]|uniref:DUF4435 domain-containing protein n=1 Tax=Thalassospira sp. MCCC 1A02491 TaxID=1769751 RepID=UPI0007AD6B5A|nr:DUF4435 domain-containing protein [Thalassospira sp. MCCC 1A02491]KZB60093.1 hypothetical protein AUQ42_08255 [Thalassospira sp. MCCC 1A02491]